MSPEVAYQKAYRKKIYDDPVRHKEYKSKRAALARAAYPRRIRSYILHREYGITIEIYRQIEDAQGGLCAICRSKNQGRRDLAVDHDHDTGKIRGLLCTRCNVAVEIFEHDENLERLITYLKKLH